MNYLNVTFYTEAHDNCCITHSTENIRLRERKEPKSSRTQDQVINDTEKRRNQKISKWKRLIRNQILSKNKEEKDFWATWIWFLMSSL